MNKNRKEKIIWENKTNEKQNMAYRRKKKSLLPCTLPKLLIYKKGA